LLAAFNKSLLINKKRKKEYNIDMRGLSTGDYFHHNTFARIFSKDFGELSNPI
jgi:hypothetical protein